MDQYGFMYDVSQSDALLLICTKECKSRAPAYLGNIKIANREENNSWADNESGEERSGSSDSHGDCKGELHVVGS